MVIPAGGPASGDSGTRKEQRSMMLDRDEGKGNSEQDIRLEDKAGVPSTSILRGKVETDSNVKQVRQHKVKRKLDTYSEAGANRIHKKRVAVLNTTSIARTRGPNHCYISLEDELVEDEKLQVLDEEFVSGSDNYNFIEDSTIPCRTLDNYTIFDANQRQRIVSWELIGEGNRDVRFVGEVKAILDNDNEENDDQESDSEEEDGVQGSLEKEMATTRVNMVQRVRSSAIFSWQDEITQNGREIWLLTQYGWYKLQKPSEEMAPLVFPVLRQLNLSSIVTDTLLNNPLIEWKEFLESIKFCTSIFSYDVAKYKYTIEDIKKYASLLNNDIDAWLGFCSESGIALHHDIFESPLLKKVRYLAGSGRIATPGNKQVNHRALRNSVSKKAKKEYPTTLTPLINGIAAKLYTRTLVVVADAEQGGKIKAEKELDNDIGLPADLTPDVLEDRRFAGRVEWVGKEIWKDDNQRSGYEQASINGRIIKPDDYISIRPRNGPGRAKPNLKGKAKENHAEEEQKGKFRFAKIVYLFENKEGEKCAHMRWFAYGTDTILEQVSGPGELFLLTICDDNNLETISGKVEIVHLRYGDEESGMGTEKNIFFYRYWYDQGRALFEDPLKHENFQFPDTYLAHQKCDSCEEDRRAKARKEIQFLNQNGEVSSITYEDVVYKKGDFVYCIPVVAGMPYRIGQIEKFGPVKSSQMSQKRPKGGSAASESCISNTATPGVTVRLLRRYDELLGKNFKVQLAEDLPLVRDSRRLIFTKEEVQIPATEIEGKCFVLHKGYIRDLNIWKNQEDTFWYDSGTDMESGITMEALRNINKEDIRIYKESILEKEKRVNLLGDFERHGEKLRGMDIFAGAGGLTIGLDKGGAVKTRWAIEFATSPAMSFKHNMPGVTVYNHCANELLDRAIKQHEGERLDDLIYFQGNVTPAMPQKGEVDFIYGGPPCQGFSDMNRFKKDDDIRNTLVATFLSYVDFYRPDYVLLENVKGLLGHKFGDIKMGTVKLIFRSLTCMGYQVRMDLLQAGQYGVPQTRRRIIFWGAKLGAEIPLCPQPTHCFPKKNGAITLPNGRTLTNSIKGSSAAYSAVVVGDVIVDLPGYEYVNPHHVYPATIQGQAEDASRPWTKYDTALSRSRKEDYVGAKKQAYRYPPLTEYQRSLREGVGRGDLTGHYTRIFDIQTTERICSIGLGAGSDHRSLPANLKPWCLSHPNSKAISNGMYPGLYGRLDPDGIFKTAVTAIRPCGKTGTILHPTQHRVISVREHARCQGFPDSYQFLSSKDNTMELHKQIGNAVPIPLAEALGRELRNVVVERWLKRST